jgi:hypothetical protein
VTLGDQQSFGIKTAGLDDKSTACQSILAEPLDTTPTPGATPSPSNDQNQSGDQGSEQSSVPFSLVTSDIEVLEDERTASSETNPEMVDFSGLSLPLTPVGEKFRDSLKLVADEMRDESGAATRSATSPQTPTSDVMAKAQKMADPLDLGLILMPTPGTTPTEGEVKAMTQRRRDSSFIADPCCDVGGGGGGRDF